MHDAQSIEAILARLMPPALSESGQQEIESMIDDLAAGSPAVRRHWDRRIIAGGLAAAGVAAALIFPLANRSSQILQLLPSAADLPEFVLIGESDRIESMTDEGWREDQDGSAMQSLRLTAIAENTLLDEQTGIEMCISQPRVEILLMPVSTF